MSNGFLTTFFGAAAGATARLGGATPRGGGGGIVPLPAVFLVLGVVGFCAGIGGGGGATVEFALIGAGGIFDSVLLPLCNGGGGGGGNGTPSAPI